MTSKPNVLFIILDTQRRDHLSLYGYERETSPRLDNFAQGATIFERAIAPAQWTIPAHGSLFTGVYPTTHQLTQAFQRLSGVHPTLAEILRVADYKTVAFCNNPLLGVLDHDLRRGFDEFYNYAGASPNRPRDQQRPAIMRRLTDEFRRLAQHVINQFATSDVLFRAATNPLVVPIWSRLGSFTGHTEHSVNDLIDYWAQHSASGDDRPLFAFLNLMGTHTPYRPPANYVDQIALDLRHDRQSRQFITRFNASAAQWLSPNETPLADWQRYALDSYYDAEIAHQDVHLGRLLDYMKRSGALDDTLVIIVADHGEGHGDHDYMGHSFVVFQELVHVPLIIHYPERFPAGKRVTTNISTRRLFHTILDVAQVTPPLAEDDPNADVEGLSLLASLNGKPDTERGIAYAEAIPPLTMLNLLKHDKQHMIEQRRLMHVRRGVYQDDYKLALVGDEVESLYNVAHDPAEAHDVAADHPQVAGDLQDKITAFVTTATDQRRDSVQQSELSDSVLENLRALGYID
jgi:arylsulfatase A-like enzyme